MRQEANKEINNVASILMLKRFIKLLLTVAILGGGSFYTYKTFIFRPSFPKLEQQSYLGSISLDEKIFTFYIEKLDHNKIVLLVISPGQLAKTIELSDAPRTLFSDLKLRFFSIPSPELYAPVNISIDKIAFLLRGHLEGQLLKGEVVSQDSVVGSWIASPYTSETRLIEQQGEDMQAWLALERRKILLQDRLERIYRSDIGQEKEVELYRDLLASKDLENRIDVLKGQLQEQTHTLDGQLNNAKDQISDLVDELALNARISNEGKAVLLSRRVSRRENKWYLANWGENRSSNSSSSQYLAAKQLGVNLESLNKAAKKAEEISRLQLEILQERQRIEQIIAPTQEQNDDSNQQRPKKRRRLFGIF